jgi:flavin reductase (DIM6/NTAB) family NADH-FMN oxidoreductase RutF
MPMGLDDPTAGAALGPASVREFADAMSALASGVVLVTCWLFDRPWGMTVTAFASVSADPPTVLASLGSETTGARTVAATGRFGVSVLAADQLIVARYGSAPGAAKFLEPFSGEDDEHRVSPVVAGALAHLDCDVMAEVEIADHTVFVGRVRTARASEGGAPLVYHRRGYRVLPDPAPYLPTGRSVRCLSR